MSNRSEREIRESIEATRARMGDTIEQIGDRVNPDRVKAELKARARDQIDEVKDNLKRKARNTMRDVEHGVSDTGRGIWATIRNNPVPAGMVGVGLAWLFANRRDSSDDGNRLGTYSTGPAVPFRAGYTNYGDMAGSYGPSAGYRADTDSERGQYGATGGYGASGFRGETRSGVTGPYGVPGGADRGEPGRMDSRSVGFEGGAGRAEWRSDASEDSEGIRDKASNALHQAGEKLGDAQNRVSEAVQGTRERVGEAVHGTRERVGEVMHHTQDRVSGWAQSARSRAQQAEHRVEDSMRENPMAAGAVAMAFGVAAGLMIPESQREHEMLGRTRDRVMGRAQEAVRRSADKLHDAARDAAGESARHAVDEIWPTGDGTADDISEPRRS